MADIEKFEEFPEDFELTEADLANFDPDDPSFDGSFNDEIPAELRDEGFLDIPTSSSKDSLAPDSIDAPVSNTSVKTVTDTTQQLKEPVEQFEEFNVDYSIEDDTFELDDEEVSPLPNETNSSNEEKSTVTSQKTDRKPGEVEDGELDGCPTNSAKRNSEFKPSPAQGPNSYRPRNNHGKNNLQNQRRAIPNHDGFQPGMRYMPYRPVNGNPRVNGMMPGMGPFPGGGNIHVNPNFRGFQQRPPFPMNPISPFGMPMMGMQPWGMNGGGFNGIRPGFGMEFNHNQGKPSDLKNSMPKKTIPVARNRDQKPDREQQKHEKRPNGSSTLALPKGVNGKRGYTPDTQESYEDRKKFHSNDGPKQQGKPKVTSLNHKQPEAQPPVKAPTNTKGIRVVVNNVADSVSRPQLVEMADSIKKGSIQSVVIDRRSNQAEMIFQTTDSAKMFRRKYHRSALAENHITIDIS